MTVAYIAKFLTVMIAMIIADVCWALYFITVSERRAFAAGAYGSVIVLLGAISTVSYVNDRTLLVAAVLGAFIGSYLTVYYKNKKQDGKSE